MKEVNGMKRYMVWVVFTLILGLCTVSLFVKGADNDPVAPDSLTRLEDERFNNSLFPAQSQQAEAGNVTRLGVEGISPTETWQGFYGNISGTISLEDAQGNVFYNWSAAEPQGRIYAANSSTVNWTSIKCFNYTANNTAVEINLTTVETMFNIADSDYDGVNETFGDGTLPSGSYTADGGAAHPGFFIGTQQIVAGTCPATTTHERGGVRGQNFIELMLTDRRNIVMATIIENRRLNNFTDVEGFDGSTHDFQMLVLDDGHAGDTNPTTWFFFVELE